MGVSKLKMTTRSVFEHANGEVWANCPVRGVFARNVGGLPPALAALSALAVLALALEGRRTAASAALVRDRREEMADARLVGDVEAVGAPWAALAVTAMAATRSVMASTDGMSAWEHRMR